MNRPIRIGLIGTGFGRRVQGPGFVKHPEFELVALASASAERAREAGRELGVGYVTDDWRKMLAEVELDLVSVVTPPVFHHPMGVAAMERGCDLLLEKPTAMHAGEAADLLRVARERGRVHALNHEFRWLPERAQAVRRIRGGAPGRVQRVAARTFMDFFNPALGLAWRWLCDAASGGGMLGAIGSHQTDWLRLVAGEVRSVTARLDQHYATKPDPAGVERPVTADDGYTVILEFESGATGVLEASAVGSGRRDLFEVQCEHETLWVEDGRLRAVKPGGAYEDVPLDPDLDIARHGADPRLDPFLAFLDALAPRLRERGEFHPNLVEGLAVQRVLDAARVSHQTGIRVQVERG